MLPSNYSYMRVPPHESGHYNDLEVHKACVELYKPWAWAVYNYLARDFGYGDGQELAAKCTEGQANTIRALAFSPYRNAIHAALKARRYA